MNTKAKDEIHVALAFLEEAAKNTALELWKLIRDQYPKLQEKLLDNVDHLRDSIDSMQEGVREKTDEIKEVSRNKVKHAASQVDEKIHHNPWYYLGGIAVSSLLLGYILGKKSG